MWLTLFSLSMAAPLSTCERTYASSEVQEASVLLIQSFEERKVENVTQAREMLDRRLPCVNEPLSRPIIGKVHLAYALSEYLLWRSLPEGDPAGEVHKGHIAPALAGLLLTDRVYMIPESLVPASHELRNFLPLAGELLQDNRTTALPTLTQGWIEVNGDGSQPQVTQTWAVVLQQIDNQNQVVETRYVWPGGDVSGWQSQGEAGGEPPPVTSSWRVPLHISTGMAGMQSDEMVQGFSGVGVRAGVGLERRFGQTLGLVTSLDYLGVWGAEGGLQSGLIWGGPSLTFEPIWLAFGPAWRIGQGQGSATTGANAGGMWFGPGAALSGAWMLGRTWGLGLSGVVTTDSDLRIYSELGLDLVLSLGG